jgi:hypothetical protein
MLSVGQQMPVPVATQFVPHTVIDGPQLRVQAFALQLRPVGQSLSMQHASLRMQVAPQSLYPAAHAGAPLLQVCVLVTQVCSPSPLASRQSALLQHELEGMQVPLQSEKPVLHWVGGMPHTPPVQVAPGPLTAAHEVPSGAGGLEQTGWPPPLSEQLPARWHASVAVQATAAPAVQWPAPSQ